MKGQDILDRCELINQELQLQSGEADATRGLLALNVAQDYFEGLASLHPDILGDSTSTLTTTASGETTPFPAGVLRIDRLQLLDSNGKIKYDLTDIRRTGGHRQGRGWNWLLPSTTSGDPVGYYTDGRNIYWDPLPDEASSVRWYGFRTASDITANGVFSYPDVLALPFAAFAVKLINLGVGDDAGEMDSLANQTFGPALKAMSNFNRSGAASFDYTRLHVT